VGLVRRSSRNRAVGPAYPRAGYGGAGYPPPGYGDGASTPPPAPHAPRAAGPAQGWYPDPERPGGRRYWNGTGWTESRV